MPGLVLAVDPGSWKLGVALLDPEGARLLRRAVLELEDLEARLPEFLGEAAGALGVVVVGDGTTSARLRPRLRALLGEEPEIETVDETGSTLEARRLYYRVHPPRGLLSWLPEGLLPEPEVPLDGFAAEVLGRRWLDPR